MIVRLLIVWMLLSSLFFGVLYLVDRQARILAGRWMARFALCAVITAAVLAMVVVIERI